MISLQYLAERLGGDVSGGQVLCPGPGHSPADRSLAVKPTGDRLLVHSFAGDDWFDCRKFIRDKLGEVGLSPSRAQPVAKTDLEHARRQHEKAEWLWHQRKPLAGSIAERYLRQVRGTTCPLPPTLAFLAPYKPEHYPALIAAFALPDEVEPGVIASPRTVEAVHLTLLKPDGSGKADVEKPKLNVGSPGSLPIVLGPVNDLGGLAITEGIEDALSVREATALGAWAAGGAGRMPPLADVIPRYVEAVTIFAHPDKAGQLGARKLVEAILRIGGVREVFIEAGVR